MPEVRRTFAFHPRTYVRFGWPERSGRNRPGISDDEALRRGGPGRTRRWDALDVRVAREALPGRGCDREVADRGPLVGRRPRSRVLAGRGPGWRGVGPLLRSPARSLARGAFVGLRNRSGVRCRS